MQPPNANISHSPRSIRLPGPLKPGEPPPASHPIPAPRSPPPPREGRPAPPRPPRSGLQAPGTSPRAPPAAGGLDLPQSLGSPFSLLPSPPTQQGPWPGTPKGPALCWWAPVGLTLGSTAIVRGAVVRPGWGLGGASSWRLGLNPRGQPGPQALPRTDARVAESAVHRSPSAPLPFFVHLCLSSGPLLGKALLLRTAVARSPLHEGRESDRLRGTLSDPRPSHTPVAQALRRP